MSELDLQLLSLCKTEGLSIEKCLLDGANVNCRCERYGYTPLMTVIFSCMDLKNFMTAFDRIQLLHKYGADYNIPDKFGNMPLIISIRWVDERYYDEINELIRLLTLGADPNLADGFGNWPLTEAIRLKNSIVFRYLLDKGANVNYINQDGDTPLHASLKVEQMSTYDKVSLTLIVKTKDLNVPDRQGNTPLMLALMNNAGDNVVINLLIRGANTNVVNHEGFTPVMLALAGIMNSDPSTFKASGDKETIQTNVDNKMKLFESLMENRGRKLYAFTWLSKFLSENAGLANVKDS